MFSTSTCAKSLHQHNRSLVGLVQVILYLLWSQQPKLAVTLAHHPHLNVVSVHLPLEPLPQRQQRRVHRVLQFHVLLVALLQEVLGVDVPLADRRGLPSEVGPAGIHLEQPRDAVAVHTSDEEGHAERPHAPRLGVLLHHRRGRLDELPDRLGLAVLPKVGLGRLARLSDQHPVIRTDAGVHETAAVGDLLHLPDALPLDERAPELLVGRDDDPVGRRDAQRRSSVGDGVERVLDLEELPSAGEGR
mmetsp:Transcript_37702/g.80558  ORF Transcript_37702/g.80558 Transcript_37702/m.80558 type:complete len:246 (+) Transcript_37702:121-858(+)